MNLFITLILIALIISSILLITHSDFPKLTKLIGKISIASLFAILLFILLNVFNLKLKGVYTNYIIGITFIISTILLFGLTKNKQYKILSGILAVPFYIFGVACLFWKMGLIFFYFISLPFEPPIATYKIDDNYAIETNHGGILSCGENLSITKTHFGILNETVFTDNGICLIGIKHIETITFTNEQLTLMIYHDESPSIKNPFSYVIKNENIW